MCGGAILSDFIRFKQHSGRKPFDFEKISDYTTTGEIKYGPGGKQSLMFKISLAAF